MQRLTLMFVIACSTGRQQPVATPPPPTHVDFELRVEDPPEAPDAGEARGVELTSPPKRNHVTRDQPPHIKLKLGHYVNTERGIGATIDLTTELDNIAAIPPAKLRFDGMTEVLTLEGAPGTRGRIDYSRGKRLVLQVYEDGRITVFVPDPDDRPAAGPISMSRDGDADPL